MVVKSLPNELSYDFTKLRISNCEEIRVIKFCQEVPFMELGPFDTPPRLLVMLLPSGAPKFAKLHVSSWYLFLNLLVKFV